MTGVAFFVPGRPQTAGSKTQVPITRGGEVVGRRVVESGDRARKASWRGDLRDAADRELRGLLAEGGDWDMGAAIALDLTIVRKRPGSMLRTGRRAGEVKDWALGLLPVERPDALKVARAAEDALTGVLWTDDSAIVEARQLKRFGDQVGLGPRSEGLVVHARPALPPAHSGAMLLPVSETEEEAEVDADYKYMVCVGGGCMRPEDEVIEDEGAALVRARELVGEALREGLSEPVQVVVTARVRSPEGAAA